MWVATSRYVVPHLIDFNHLEDSLTCSFRVTKKMVAGTFNVTQNGKVIASKKAKYIAPAEMENIIIKKQTLFQMIQSQSVWRNQYERTNLHCMPCRLPLICG